MDKLLANRGDVIRYSLGKEHGHIACVYECEIAAVLMEEEGYGVYVSYGQDIVPFNQAEIIKRNSMPDISKCNGIDCPIKNDCYRHTAPDGIIQAYGVFKYKEGKGCTWFWDNKSND